MDFVIKWTFEVRRPGATNFSRYSQKKNENPKLVISKTVFETKNESQKLCCDEMKGK